MLVDGETNSFLNPRSLHRKTNWGRGIASTISKFTLELHVEKGDTEAVDHEYMGTISRGTIVVRLLADINFQYFAQLVAHHSIAQELLCANVRKTVHKEGGSIGEWCTSA